MSYRLTDEGWMLSGYDSSLGAVGDEPITDVDISGLTEHILKKILDAKINLEVVELHLGMLIPDVAERILVRVAAGYISTQIQKKLDLKDKAKASNVADALADHLVEAALTELAETADIMDFQTIMQIDASAAIAEAVIGTPYDDIASTPLGYTEGYVGGTPMQIIGLSPFHITRASIFLLGNPSLAKVTGFDIRSFISNKIESAILEFAEWAGYEPPPGQELFDWGGGITRKYAMEVYADYALEEAERVMPTERLEIVPAKKLPVVPIAIGIAAYILLF
jgi:hypothetical protein